PVHAGAGNRCPRTRDSRRAPSLRSPADASWPPPGRRQAARPPPASANAETPALWSPDNRSWRSEWERWSGGGIWSWDAALWGRRALLVGPEPGVVAPRKRIPRPLVDAAAEGLRALFQRLHTYQDRHGDD